MKNKLILPTCRIPGSPIRLQAMDRYFMTVPDKWTGFAMSNSVPNFDGVDLDHPAR